MRKLSLTLIGLFICSNALATSFFVKNAGDDSKDGLSDANAWKTVSKVNAQSFSPNDKVYFNRGDTWREQLIADSGTSSGYVTYGAYGTGDKPLFLGSIQENDAGDWTDLGGNIWSNNDAEFDREVGNLIFNGATLFGIGVAEEGDVDAQAKFWYDEANDLIKIYSVGNPATFYSDIECALWPEDDTDYFVNVQNRNYVIVENFDVRYFSSVGIGGAYTTNIIVRDCDLSYGGGDWNGARTLRKGNAIQWWANADSNLVERCRIDNMYDAGVTNQDGTGTGVQNNIVFKNNIITNCEFSYEQWGQGASAVASNISFDNNTCLYAGSGWGHNQRPDAVNGRHLMFYSNTATTSNFTVTNNIFFESTESSIRWQKDVDVSDYSLNYNSYFESAGDVVVITDGSTYTFGQFANYQSDTGQDANSITDNPLLGSNYTLNTSSPCIGAGTRLIGVLHDFRGGHRAEPNDIGVYIFDDVLINCTINNATIN